MKKEQNMKCDKQTILLYAVTDRAWVGKMSLYEQIEATLKNGATCIQLREKHLDDEMFLEEARQIAALCKQYNVPLIINDNVSVAIQCNAEGIHVGQEDMTVQEVRKLVGDQMMIGVSANTKEEALLAAENGADYLGIGAVFNTTTKSDIRLISYHDIQEICRSVDIPTVAIGGISKKNILELVGSGVDGVAVVSAIFAADDPGKATAELLELAKKVADYDV